MENKMEKQFKTTFANYLNFREVKTLEEMERQEFFQNAWIEGIDKGLNGVDLIKFIKRAIKCDIIDKKKSKEMFTCLDLSEENFENEVYVEDKGKFIELRIAIEKSLNPIELKYFNLYNEGYTLKEICSLVNVNFEMQVLRVLKRVWKKIDGLKASYLYDNRYTAIKQKSKRANNNYFSPYQEENDMAVKRNFLCLDQNRNPKIFPYRKNVNVCPTVGYFEVKNNLLTTGNVEVKRLVKNNLYSKSMLPIEVKPLEVKREEKPLEVKREKPYNFNYGKFISDKYGLVNI
jgi:hypothetical protein